MISYMCLKKCWFQHQLCEEGKVYAFPKEVKPPKDLFEDIKEVKSKDELFEIEEAQKQK